MPSATDPPPLPPRSPGHPLAAAPTSISTPPPLPPRPPQTPPSNQPADVKDAAPAITTAHEQMRSTLPHAPSPSSGHHVAIAPPSAAERPAHVYQAPELFPDASSATADLRTPSPILKESGDLHKSLPTPPNGHERPLSGETSLPSALAKGQSAPQSKPSTPTSADFLQPPSISSPPPEPEDKDKESSEPQRTRRATISEKTRAIHKKAVQHAEEGEAPPIIKDAVLGMSPLVMGGLAVIALLSIKLFGFWLFAKIGAFGLAPVAALWLLPLPSVAEKDTMPPPPPADNVGWINHTLRTLFPLVSTDVLTPFVDLLEDALIQQVPPIVTSVRCTDVTLGRESIQLQTLRTITNEEWFATISENASQGHVGTASRPVSAISLAAESGNTSETNGASLAPGSVKRRHQRNPSASSAKSAKSATSVPSRPPSGSSQLSTGKEEAKMRKRDRIARRLRRGRHGRKARADSPELGLQDDDDGEEEVIEDDEDEVGEGMYVNYEVSFTYTSTREMGKKGTGLHMLAYFGWGLKGLGGSEIPVYIDVLRLSGTLRLRLLLSPSPPFVRDALFTFVKMPEFDISARPLRSFGFGSINAMDLPLIKTYVQKSIAQVAGTFVSPRHYHLDIERLLLGKDAAVRTSSVGVLYLQIHGCDDLPRTDTMGSCDPYVVASFSKFKKPLFSTRVIVDDLNPVFEEPALVLVSAEAIEVGEQLRLRVLDSDRFSMDDSIGHVSVDISEIIEQSQNSLHNYGLFRRHDDLQPDQPGMKAQGQLDWSIRFFPLWQIPVDEFHRRLEEIRDRRGEGKTIPPWWLNWLEDLMEKPEWENQRAKRRKEMVEYFTGERERDEIEAALPPTGEFPSGVLQFHVHQCAELEMNFDSRTFSSSNMSRRKSAASGKPALSDVLDRSSGENPDPPSAYCEVHLNDKYVFRTRTKRVNPQPYFNALSERFIRDWRHARIKFVVKDERDREHDPIIGIVSLRLKDMLADRAQVTRWFPIVGGLGFGKLRISLLFKPVDIKLPRGVSSYEACTFDITNVLTTDFDETLGRVPEMVIESEHDRAILTFGDEDEASSRPRSGSLASSKLGSSTRKDVSGGEADTRSLSAQPRPVGPNVEWELPNPIRLAIQYRHSCSMVISFVTRRLIKKTKVHAIGVLSLGDVPDEESTRRTIPIFATQSVRDAMRATTVFNAYTASSPSAPADGALARTVSGTGKSLLPPDLHDLKLVGFVKLTFVLHPGVSRAHRKLRKRDLKFKAVYDAWEATRLVESGTGTGMTGTESPPEPGSSAERGESSDSDSDLDMSDGETPNRDSQDLAAAMHDDDTRAMVQSARAHSKALHRNNKGIFQLKLARTGKFVLDKVQARVLSTTGGSHLASRPHGVDIEVEHEGQSKL